MELWRISNYRSMSGEGGLRYSARWHTAGRPIVYLAASPAGALIEVLVHLELEEDSLPPNYTLLRLDAAATVAVEEIRVPENDVWKSDQRLSRSLGDEWLESTRTALARVPSAILPDTYNYLLNPLHLEAEHIRIVDATQAKFDPKLLKHLRG